MGVWMYYASGEMEKSKRWSISNMKGSHQSLNRIPGSLYRISLSWWKLLYGSLIWPWRFGDVDFRARIWFRRWLNVSSSSFCLYPYLICHWKTQSFADEVLHSSKTTTEMP
jgi:hypothetical protein